MDITRTGRIPKKSRWFSATSFTVPLPESYRSGNARLEQLSGIVGEGSARSDQRHQTDAETVNAFTVSAIFQSASYPTRTGMLDREGVSSPNFARLPARSVNQHPKLKTLVFLNKYQLKQIVNICLRMTPSKIANYATSRRKKNNALADYIIE